MPDLTSAERASAAEASPAPWRRPAALVLKLLFVVVAIYFTHRVIGQIGWSDLGRRLAGARRPLLALALLSMFGRFLSWELRWRLALARLGAPPPAVRTFCILMGAIAINLLTPSFRVLGGLFRARCLARDSGGRFARFYGTVLFDQVANQAVTTVATWAAIVAMAWHLGRRPLAIVGAVLLAAALVLVAVWTRGAARSERRNPLLRFLLRLAERRESRLHPVYERSSEVVHIFSRLLADGRLRAAVLALGTVYFLLNASAQWAVFAAIGSDVGPAQVAIAVAVGTAFGALTGAPGGLGSTEAGMIACYGALGVSSLEAVAGTLLYRALHYLLALVLGLPSLGYFALRPDRPTSGLRPAPEGPSEPPPPAAAASPDRGA